jgi:hypothetical protein
MQYIQQQQQQQEQSAPQPVYPGSSGVARPSGGAGVAGVSLTGGVEVYYPDPITGEIRSSANQERPQNITPINPINVTYTPQSTLGPGYERYAGIEHMVTRTERGGWDTRAADRYLQDIGIRQTLESRGVQPEQKFVQSPYPQEPAVQRPIASLPAGYERYAGLESMITVTERGGIDTRAADLLLQSQFFEANRGKTLNQVTGGVGIPGEVIDRLREESYQRQADITGRIPVTYVPVADRTQMEVKGWSFVEPKTGEIAVYGPKFRDVGRPFGEGELVGGTLVAGGGRYAAQSGMFSTQPLTPNIVEQATGKYITVNRDIIANPQNYSRLGAEAYEGKVMALDGRTLQAGSQMSVYPAATGNLAALTLPESANLKKEDAPGANIPWGITASQVYLNQQRTGIDITQIKAGYGDGKMSMPEGIVVLPAPFVSRNAPEQQIDELRFQKYPGFTGGLIGQTIFGEKSSEVIVGGLAATSDYITGLVGFTPFKSMMQKEDPALQTFRERKSLLETTLSEQEQYGIKTFGAEEGKIKIDTTNKEAVAFSEKYAAAQKQYEDLNLEAKKSGLVKFDYQTGTYIENPNLTTDYGEFSKWGSGAARTIREKLGYTEEQLETYGLQVQQKTGISSIPEKIVYGTGYTLSTHPERIVAAYGAGVGLVFGGAVVGGLAEGAGITTTMAGWGAAHPTTAAITGGIVKYGIPVALTGAMYYSASEGFTASPERTTINIGKMFPEAGAMVLGGATGYVGLRAIDAGYIGYGTRIIKEPVKTVIILPESYRELSPIKEVTIPQRTIQKVPFNPAEIVYPERQAKTTFKPFEEGITQSISSRQIILKEPITTYDLRPEINLQEATAIEMFDPFSVVKSEIRYAQTSTPSYYASWDRRMELLETTRQKQQGVLRSRSTSPTLSQWKELAPQTPEHLKPMGFTDEMAAANLREALRSRTYEFQKPEQLIRTELRTDNRLNVISISGRTVAAAQTSTVKVMPTTIVTPKIVELTTTIQKTTTRQFEPTKPYVRVYSEPYIRSVEKTYVQTRQFEPTKPYVRVYSEPYIRSVKKTYVQTRQFEPTKPYVPIIPIPNQPVTPHTPTPMKPIIPLIPPIPGLFFPSGSGGGGGGGIHKRRASFKETFWVGLDMSVRGTRFPRAKSYTSPKSRSRRKKK